MFSSMLELFKKHKRKITGESSLDFSHSCVFRHQLKYRGVKHGSGEIVEVDMKSGKIGLYKLTSEVYNTIFEDTGQRNWFFEFVGYKK